MERFIAKSPNGKVRTVVIGANGFSVYDGKEVTGMYTDEKGNTILRGNFNIVSEKTEGMRALDDD